MASTHLELVRSIYAAWECGDFGSLTWADAEIELVVADGPEPVSIRGLRAALEYWREFLGAWKGYRIAADEYRELDDELVLVLMHCGSGRAKTPGAELGRGSGRGAQAFTVRGGRVTRLVSYLDRQRALAEHGLAGQSAAADPR